VAGVMIDPRKRAGEKLAAMPKMIGYYAAWYPPLWLRGLAGPLRYSDWGRLAPHLRFVERSCRKLARESFHGMAVYQAKMERKQGFLFRCVDIVMELFAMAATTSRARQMADDRDPEAQKAAELADLFCRMSRRKVRQLFRQLWRNEDTRRNEVAARVLRGDHAWLERGILDMGLTPESFKTQSLVAARAKERSAVEAS
jgi:hypothetical protein